MDESHEYLKVPADLLTKYAKHGCHNDEKNPEATTVLR
jgi:hypothetical protein